MAHAQALAMNGQDCGVWTLDKKHLLHYDASGALQQKIDLKSVDKKLEGADQLAIDPYDGSIWIADHKKLAHLSSAGTVLTESTLNGPVRSIAVALDQSVWVLGNKQLWHFSAQGSLLASVSLHQFVKEAPQHLVVDHVGGVLWLAGSKQVVQLKLDRLDQVALTISLSEHIASFALNPLTSQLWIATHEQLHHYDLNGTLIGSVHFADAGLKKPDSIVFDPAANGLWIAAKDAVARYSADGVLQAVFPAEHANGLIAVPGFSVQPLITLIQPPQDALTNNAKRQISIGFDALCNGQSCGFAPSYFAGYSLTASINAQPVGSLFVFDPATG